MKKNMIPNFTANTLYKLLKLSFFILIVMFLSRVYLFISYFDGDTYEVSELLSAFFLGSRLDLSIVAYLTIFPILFLIVINFTKSNQLKKYAYKVLQLYYLFVIYSLIVISFVDHIYFSFFAEHITIMIFGVFNDDTGALINTAFTNYNVPLVVFIGLIFYIFIYFVIKTILKENHKKIYIEWNLKKQIIFSIVVVIFIALLARGSLGLFPLAKYIPDVSADPFINKVPQTPTYALVYAYKQYKRSKSGKYDLIKDLGYKGKLDDAFLIHTQLESIDKEDLLKNILYKTKTNLAVKEKAPHVVVVMVESFGMPLLDYQSDTFNIMGKLKKHFEEDILFTNFISSGNGTVSSLEALLLNIPSRPGATAFGQSNYLNTPFKNASARVYQDAGYETSFVYGGDLSWRNVGSFMSRQGFTSVKGKAQIVKSLGLDATNDSHDWGVYDEHSYKYVLKKLKNAQKPQFVFLLTTNNHPPYKIPQTYLSNSLKFSDNLTQHIKGDIGLAKKRFRDYAYAVDMAGGFMDEIKKTSLKDNTVVAITADNNTVEGIMRYDKHYTQTKRIPFYIYLPEYLNIVTFDTTLASSHKDIFPTLYNLTLSDSKYLAIGKDLQEKSTLRCGFNKAGILVSNVDGFEASKAMTNIQKECAKYYKASLVVTQYMIESNKK